MKQGFGIRGSRSATAEKRLRIGQDYVQCSGPGCCIRFMQRDFRNVYCSRLCANRGYLDGNHVAAQKRHKYALANRDKQIAYLREYYRKRKKVFTARACAASDCSVEFMPRRVGHVFCSHHCSHRVYMGRVVAAA